MALRLDRDTQGHCGLSVVPLDATEWREDGALDATEWHEDGALDATEWHALPRTPANPIPHPVTAGVSRRRRTVGMSNNRGALMGR